MTAADDLKALVVSLPGADNITDNMIEKALAGSLMPDANGVWPGQEGYIETQDIYWAAVSLVAFLSALPVIRSASSEGTAMSQDAPSWGGLTAYYKSMSPIAQATSSTVLGSIPIPATPHVYRTNMNERGSQYGDVDTDLG